MNDQKQFQLHSLLTEQRHLKTWSFSSEVKQETSRGIASLLAVDEDISQKIMSLTRKDSPEGMALERASSAIERALRTGHKIYIYGCGATGRLAKQMESSFWRPFWNRLDEKNVEISKKVRRTYPAIENQVVGEMTGGDRALISSLEGFEDLQLMGQLQLRDHQIGKQDVILAVSEGGETSSVIGALLEGRRMHEPFSSEDDSKLASQHLYFFYNNPDSLLRPFDRAREILDCPAITKIPLTTGQQALAGSTRMQATTSETFVLGLLLEEALIKILKPLLSVKNT